MWKFGREFSLFFFFFALWRCFNFQGSVSEWVVAIISVHIMPSCQSLKTNPLFSTSPAHAGNKKRTDSLGGPYMHPSPNPLSAWL